jgi:hypothetical protein
MYPKKIKMKSLIKGYEWEKGLGYIGVEERARNMKDLRQISDKSSEIETRSLRELPVWLVGV